MESCGEMAGQETEAETVSHCIKSETTDVCKSNKDLLSPI
jgi:hypothetical protein